MQNGHFSWHTWFWGHEEISISPYCSSIENSTSLKNHLRTILIISNTFCYGGKSQLPFSKYKTPPWSSLPKFKMSLQSRGLYSIISTYWKIIILTPLCHPVFNGLGRPSGIWGNWLYSELSISRICHGGRLLNIHVIEQFSIHEKIDRLQRSISVIHEIKVLLKSKSPLIGGILCNSTRSVTWHNLSCDVIW